VSRLGRRVRVLLVSLLAVGSLAVAPIAVSAPARLASVHITSVTSPVSHGSNATLVARVSPSTVTCSIAVYYKSGKSVAAGLGNKRPSAGRVSWTWKVGTRTTPGRWRITVSCRAGSATTYFRVT
jgi:hypothetical protein